MPGSLTSPVVLLQPQPFGPPNPAWVGFTADFAGELPCSVGIATQYFLLHGSWPKSAPFDWEPF